MRTHLVTHTTEQERSVYEVEVKNDEGDAITKLRSTHRGRLYTDRFLLLIDPAAVRELRKAFETREAELVERGYLEPESEDRR
jgi:hypothetical protein